MFHRKIKEFVGTILGSDPALRRRSFARGETVQGARAKDVGLSATVREEKRDLLFGLLREAMLQKGILSCFYRSNITTLDSTGLSHKITVDIAPQFGGSPELLRQLECAIAVRAARLAEIRLVAVYWRSDESLALPVGSVQAG